jgi:hypothetical protein
LTIVPATPEWQRATLQQALKDLESSQPVTDPESPRLRGAKTLRYLGSPDAVKTTPISCLGLSRLPNMKSHAPK